MIKDKDGLTEKEFLDSYSMQSYQRPSVAVDSVVFTIDETESNDIRKLNQKNLQVLLVKRKEHPFIDSWALAGGFLGLGETLEDAYLKSLNLKTKIDKIYLEQLYTFDDLKRDPRGRVLSVAYMGLANKANLVVGETDAVAWFNLKAQAAENKVILHFENKQDKFSCELKTDKNNIDILKNGKLGFDHAKIIYYALTRLKNKIEWTDIAFSMLPSEFTQAELMQVYEVILDKKLTKANFQRKIKDKIKPLKKFKTGGFRPAELYEYINN